MSSLKEEFIKAYSKSSGCDKTFEKIYKTQRNTLAKDLRRFINGFLHDLDGD